MKCIQCQFDNPADMRFCGACGARLVLVCTACGSANPLEHRFCGSCGQKLAGDGPSPGAADAPVPAPSESPADSLAPANNELRQVTALFCDLIDSTRLSSRLDPESYRHVLTAFREVCVRAVRRMGGEVARYLGDGLLMAFGWPIAWEDDARRAVRAALAIRDALPSLALPAGVPAGTLQVRIGIHTGLVVVGDLSAGDRTEHDALLGQAPNIAARIQAEAGPNVVLISGFTASLVEPYFVLERLGPRMLRGLDEPIELVAVLRESGVRDRMDTLDPTSPLLGRRQELSLLLQRWDRARDGRGDAVLLIGEPGIGKSRLLAEVRRTVAIPVEGDPPARILTIGCSAYDTTSALRPFIEVLEQDVGLGTEGLKADNAAAFAEALAQRGVQSSLQVAALGSLFDAAGLFDTEWQRLSPERKRGELFEALSGWILSHPQGRPILLLVEDVHWADESTLALLGHLLERLRESSAFVVMTGRPEFQSPWPSRLGVSQIALQRLDAEEARRLVQVAAGVGALSLQDIDRIVDRADGVPLFVEELVRELRDRRATEAPIPATLRDLLMARLDRVRAAKSLLEICALLGKTFDLALLVAVAGRPEADVQRELALAIDAEFLEMRGMAPLARLGFRHALIREAVHESTLRQRRAQLHRRIATVMRASFPEIVERQPEVLAAHCAAGGLAQAAIEAWQRAGRRATERSAYAEAARHYRAAVAAIAELPDDPTRDETELGLQVALGAQMIAARGNAAPEVEAAYRRAEALCGRVANPTLRFRALRGLMSFFMVRGRPAEAGRIGDQLLAMAQPPADNGLRLQVHRPLGLNLFYLGRFAEAIAQFDQALALHDPVAHADHRHEYGSDPAVLALCNRGWVHWFAGSPDAALADCRAAVERARALDHPHSLAFALSLLASVHQGRREPGQALSTAREVGAIAAENGFPYWTTWGQMVGGWATAQRGEPRSGIDAIEAGLAAYRATGAEGMVPYFAALLAESLLLDGGKERALAVIEDGLALARKHQINFYGPELLRLRGRLTGAESAREAISWSRQLGARTLELRATLELVALQPDALDELTAVRALFKDDPMLPDLAEADARLDRRGAGA